MANLSQRTTQATLWSAIEIASRYGFQLVVTIVLAHLLSPDDFGLIAMLLVFTSLGAVLMDAGFGTALIQRQETSEDDETTVFIFNVCAGLLGGGILWISAHGIAAFYHQRELEQLTCAIAWVLPLSALGAVPDALLTQKLEFRARAKAQIISSVVSGLVAVIAAFKGFGVWSLVIQALIASGLRTACLWVFSRWRPSGHFNTRSFKQLFGFGGFMLLSGLLNTVSVRLQSLLIGKFFDSGTLGYYSLAQNTTSAPTSLIGALLSRVGLPVFSKLADDKQRLREALRTSLGVSMFVFVPCMVGLAIVARPLINSVYGMRWESASPIVSLLALGGALWPLHVLNLAALSAQGHSNRFFYLEVLKNIITVIATIASVAFGTIAVAGAMLIVGLCGVAVNTWYTHRMLNYGMLAQLKDQRATFLLALIAALPAWAILHWTMSSLPMTALAVLVAALVYVGLAASLRTPAWVQLLALIRDMTQLTPTNNAPD